MKIANSRLWSYLRKNKIIYYVVHNTLGLWLADYQLRDRKRLIRRIGLETINEVDGILSHAGVLFYVDFGTLLGLVRNGQLLSWDYDIDFGIHFSKSFNWKDLELLMQQHGFKLIKQFEYDKVITEQTYRREEVYIDFFNHFTESDHDYYYIYYKQDGYIYNDDNEIHARVTKTHNVTNSVIYSINNYSIHIPENAEEYLSDVYGPDWKIPQKHWSPNSLPNIIYLTGMGIMTLFE